VPRLSCKLAKTDLRLQELTDLKTASIYKDLVFTGLGGEPCFNASLTREMSRDALAKHINMFLSPEYAR